MSARLLPIVAALLCIAHVALAQPVETLNPYEDATGAVVDIDTQKVCVTGSDPGKPCSVDADCPGGGTCSPTRIGLQGSWVGRPVRLPSPIASRRTITTGPDAITLFSASTTPCQRCCIGSLFVNANLTVCANGTNNGTACTSDATCTGGGTCDLAALYIGYDASVDDTNGEELLPGDYRCLWAPPSLDCAGIFIYGQNNHQFNGRCE